MEQKSQQEQTQASCGERRLRSRRFTIKAEAHFSWLGPDGVWRSGTGTTENISLHGVFIRTYFVPMPTAAVEVHVSIPSLVTNGGALRLTGTGTVLRIDPPGSQPTGFAAEMIFQTTGIGAPFGCDSETEIH